MTDIIRQTAGHRQTHRQTDTQTDTQTQLIIHPALFPFVLSCVCTCVFSFWLAIVRYYAFVLYSIFLKYWSVCCCNCFYVNFCQWLLISVWGNIFANIEKMYILYDNLYNSHLPLFFLFFFFFRKRLRLLRKFLTETKVQNLRNKLCKKN